MYYKLIYTVAFLFFSGVILYLEKKIKAPSFIYCLFFRIIIIL